MSKSIFGIIIGLFMSLSARAEQPIFTISSANANPGEIIDIDFHVDDFTDIISVQYSVNWNPAVLRFRTVKNFNSGVQGLNSPSVFNTMSNFIDNGIFTLGWFEGSVTPTTIPDGSLFFTVEFEVIGAPCQNSTIAITDNPTEIEVAEVGLVEVGLVANNGTVSVPGTGCVENIHFLGNSVVGPCGGSTCIEFRVENFTTVGAIEFSLVYNPSVLQFDHFQNFAPLPAFGSGNTNLLSPGTLRVLWFNGNAENSSLPDGTILFEICFDVIGSGGQSTQITFGNNPSVMISDIDGNFHEVSITPAVVTAQCQLEGFALIADTVCTMPGELACFDIKVNDFEDILAMQFSINWNPALFEFVSIGNFNLQDLDATLFSLPGDPNILPGQLALAWFPQDLEVVTVPDFTTIFTLCLRAIGAAGTSSAISFTDIPGEIEIATEDEVLDYSLLHGRGEIRLSCEGCNLSYTLTATSPDCPREETGMLTLAVSEDCDGSPTFLWSNNQTTQNLTNIGAGTYTVTITLPAFGVVIATGTVVDPVPIAVTGTITNPNPPGTSTGGVNITVTGGCEPYTYQWNTTPVTTTQDITNVPAGMYTVTVTDCNGCVFIPDPYFVGAELSGSITNVSCNGGSNGAINLSVSFGTGPYTYSWNTTPPTTTEDLSNLTAGQYCVTVTDNTGATRNMCFTVTQPDPLVLTGTIAHDVNENCTGAIDLHVTGGTMPYNYVWSNGPTTQDITQLCAGQYCVTVTDGQGCTMNTCFNVGAGGVLVSLVATQYGNFQTSCSNVCDGEITSVVSGGTGTLTYAWSNNATTDDISNVCAGTYTLTVTDGSGQTATASIVLRAPNPITVSFITTNPTDFITSNGAISAVVNGGTPPYTYLWTGPSGGNTAALNNVTAGTYTLLVTDANGCEFLISRQLLPDLDVDCYTAIKVITPNSDGKNDFFIITCVYDFDNRLFIFNRQGGLVYETSNYQNTWDGANQDSEPVPDGGYLWVLEVYRPDGSTQLVKGTVNVLRTAD